MFKYSLPLDSLKVLEPVKWMDIEESRLVPMAQVVVLL
jgi:hypothetical protein